MPLALVVLADGFEEIEAITPIDFLRRAGVLVTVAGLTGLKATSARGVVIGCDTTLDLVPDDWDLLVLPGGQPGATHLAQSGLIKAVLEKGSARGAWISAICASPLVVLGSLGYLKGRRFTGYPGTPGEAPESQYLLEPVVIDGRFVTSRGVGTAQAFALKLVELLAGPERSQQVAKAVLLA